MYTPRAFALDDLPEIQQLIQHTRLAQLVTFGEQGLQASHLPLLLNPDEGAHGTLYGHLAKANPQWRDLHSGSEALVIFAGADAYVSPAFYPAKAEHGKVVPTWNYIAVHAYGKPEVFTDAKRLLAVVTALTDRHEGNRAQPWKVSDAPADYIDGMSSAFPCRSNARWASANSARTAAKPISMACARAWPPAWICVIRPSPAFCPKEYQNEPDRHPPGHRC